MNRQSRLPVRTSAVLEPGSTLKESKNENRRTRPNSTSRPGSITSNEPSSVRRSKSSTASLRTSSSVRSSRITSKTPTDPQRIKKKDDRPVQDKQWQTLMLTMTETYFQEDERSLQLLNKGKISRPITINMFVELMNFILKNIDSSFEDITTKDYVDILPRILTMLMYPGTCSSTLFKTANTMHSWPHILAILSWLVQLDKIMKVPEKNIDEFVFRCPTDATEEIKLRQLERKIVISAYSKWNSSQHEGNIEKEFEEGIIKIYNFSGKKMNRLQSKVEHLSSKLQQQEDIFTLSNDEIQDMELNIEKLNESITTLNDTKEHQMLYVEQLETRIKDVSSATENLVLEQTKYKSINSQLEDETNTQKMSKVEYDEQIKIIDDFKAKKCNFLCEKQNLQNISDDVDLKLSQTRREIDILVSTFNMTLMQMSLKYSQIKDFVLRQEKYLYHDFYEAIEEQLKNGQMYRETLAIELEQSRYNFYTISEENLNEQQYYEKLQQEENELQKKLEVDETNCDELFKQTEEMEQNKLKITENYIQELNEYGNFHPNIKEKMQEISELAKMYHYLKNTFNEKESQMLNFFQNLQEEILEFQIPQYREMRRMLSEAVEIQTQKVKIPKDLFA